MSEYFEIEIEDGELRYEGSGFEGASCEEVFEEVFADLGEEQERKRKGEYYRSRRTATRRRARE